MGKSFSELLIDSFSVFKKSFFPVLGVWGILFGVMIFISIIAILLIALTAGTQALSNMQNPAMLMMTSFTTVAGIVIVSALVSYIFIAWMILIIRNNALIGESFFKATFFEAVRKIWKIIVLGILMFVVYAAIMYISFLISRRFFFLIMLPFMIAIAPSMFTAFYAIMCKEGGFWDIISEAFALSFARWFKIAGYIILFMICYFVVLFAVMFGVTYLFNAIKLPALGSIIVFAFQVCVMIISQCFYTIFYLDLAGIKPQEEIDLTEQVMEPVLEQPVEPKAVPPVEKKDNDEPPHMDVLK